MLCSFSSTRCTWRLALDRARMRSRELAQPFVVVDRVHGVEAQAVEAIFVEPVERVVEEEVAHLRPLEVDRRRPTACAAFAEKRLRIRVQIIAVRAEVVVDDVEKHHQAEAVRGVDQRSSVLRAAVRGVGRVRQHAVIAPVARAGKIVERHQFDGGHAELRELPAGAACTPA